MSLDVAGPKHNKQFVNRYININDRRSANHACKNVKKTELGLLYLLYSPHVTMKFRYKVYIMNNIAQTFYVVLRGRKMQ